MQVLGPAAAGESVYGTSLDGTNDYWALTNVSGVDVSDFSLVYKFKQRANSDGGSNFRVENTNTTGFLQDALNINTFSIIDTGSVVGNVSINTNVFSAAAGHGNALAANTTYLVFCSRDQNVAGGAVITDEDFNVVGSFSAASQNTNFVIALNDGTATNLYVGRNGSSYSGIDMRWLYWVPEYIDFSVAGNRTQFVDSVMDTATSLGDLSSISATQPFLLLNGENDVWGDNSVGSYGSLSPINGPTAPLVPI